MITIRKAQANDLLFIMQLYYGEAAHGHFHSRIDPFLFRINLEAVVEEGNFVLVKDNKGEPTEVPARLEVITRDDQLVGFHLLIEPAAGSVEYYLLAILPAYRRRGYAERLLQRAFRKYPTMNFIARIYPESEVMYQFLRRRGFIHESTSLGGVRTLYKNLPHP